MLESLNDISGTGDAFSSEKEVKPSSSDLEKDIGGKRVRDGSGEWGRMELKDSFARL